VTNPFKKSGGRGPDYYLNLLSEFRQAALLSKRSIVSLLAEAARLRLSAKRLGPSEYIDFQLYKDDLSWHEKSSFGGQRTQHMLEEILIDDYSRFLSLDKVTMYSLLSGLNLPIPKIRATYRTQRPSSIPQLHTASELAQFVSNTSNLPLYIKRSFGSYGRGNVLVTGFDGENVVFGDGKTKPLSQFCESLDDGKTLGWILQEPLFSHPAIFELTNSRNISGIRIHTISSKQTVHVTKAIFKINLGMRDSDNFEHGASGNMLAAVDTTNGKIIRAISGVGRKQTQIPIHPTTGKDIVGFTIPDWDKVLEVVRDAHRAFPGFICPGWDIALTPHGPKILEANAFGDIDLSQHAYRQSFLDKEFLSHLSELGLDQLLYAKAQRRSQSATNNRMGIRKHHWNW
jgi:Sugar-transfer associated ATP-grasp